MSEEQIKNALQKLQTGIKREATIRSVNTKQNKTQLLDLKDKIWRPMSNHGQFILLNVADSYLMNEFEYSLRLSTNNFSSICFTPLFEGNILRFRALANLKLFECGLEEGDTSMMQ